MMILLGMPVIEIILFGFAISTEVKNVRVAVIDPSSDFLTRRIIDRVDASDVITSYSIHYTKLYDDDISIPALVDYLRQSHIYFLDFS